MFEPDSTSACTPTALPTMGRQYPRPHRGSRGSYPYEGRDTIRRASTRPPLIVKKGTAGQDFLAARRSPTSQRIGVRSRLTELRDSSRSAVDHMFGTSRTATRRQIAPRAAPQIHSAMYTIPFSQLMMELANTSSRSPTEEPDAPAGEGPGQEQPTKRRDRAVARPDRRRMGVPREQSSRSDSGVRASALRMTP